LKEKDKTAETGVSFLEETDFGRVYLQQRVNYIATVYEDKEREKIEKLVNTLQRREEFEKGNVSQPLTEYFERGVRNRKNKLIMEGGVDIETKPNKVQQLNGKTVEIAGKRLPPYPAENKLNDAERTLLNELRKLFGDDDKTVRRIAETEISAAYNLGRIHAMYNRGETLVRWINDRENTLSGKVCQICLSIAMGRTTKPQVKDLIPPDLSGVYTLDEVLTERQLALPAHPFCLCHVRPLNDNEKSRIGVIPEGLGEIVTSAIATVGAAGTSTINVQEDEQRANQWWGSSFVKNAALIGAGVVTMSAALFWMRKSLGNRGAAELLKRKGADIAERVEKRRINPKTILRDQQITGVDAPKQITGGTDVPGEAPITQRSVDESLVISDDIEAPIPEQGEALPDLGRIMRNLSEIEKERVEDLYSIEVINRTVSDQARVQLGNLDNIPEDELPLVRGQIQRELFMDEQFLKQLTNEEIGGSEELQKAVEFIRKQAEEDLKTTRKLYTKVEKELVRRNADTSYVPPKPLGTFEREVQLYGEAVDGRLKKIDRLVKRTEQVLDGFNNRGTSRLEYNRHKEETKQLAKLLKELEQVEASVGENNIPRFEDYVDTMSRMDDWGGDPEMTRLIREAQVKVEKIQRARSVLGQMEDKLTELTINVPTYLEKVKSGEVVDPFIKTDVSKLVTRTEEGLTTGVNARIKVEALRERRKTLQQLKGWLQQSDVKTPFTGGLNPELRKVLSQLGEDYDTFMGLNNTRMKKRMGVLITKLEKDIEDMDYRLNKVEFRRYQQKWMAEFVTK
jgi:hypothetical protein